MGLVILMADSIKLPGLGEVPRKKALLFGGIAVAGVGALIVISRRRAAASAASTPVSADTATATGDAYPSDGTTGNPSDPDSVDPATGVTYGDEGGLSAGTDYSDYGGGALDDTGDAGTSTGYDAEGYPIGSAADLEWQATQGTSGAISTNSAWMTEALALLPGGASSANSTALSSVLAGITVTAAQAAIFNQALALAGQPPQGYPPINQSSTAAQPTGSGSAGKTTVNTAPTGFKVKSINGNNVTLQWNPVAGASGYTIAYGKTLASAQQYKQAVSGGSTSSATVADVGGATPGGAHYFEVWADPAAPNGPHAGPIQVTLAGAKPK